MAKTTPRLFVEQSLYHNAEISLPTEQVHYLIHVLRLTAGDAVSLFNGQDGEWLGYITELAKKKLALRLERKQSDVKPPPDLDYLFAPLKHARLDYMIQKATELGVRRLRPVITARTIAERVNLERMRANAIEAAEQCNLVHVPEVVEPVKFATCMAQWQSDRSLVFCDETASVQNPIDALRGLTLPAAVIVGPEGGFTDDERAQLRGLASTHAISLGPRILRADTAAIASLTLVQAITGDWAINKS